MFNCDLPSGASVSVEAPTFQDRMDAIKEFRASKDEQGFTVEELLAAKSIAAVNGATINQATVYDPILLIADWANADVQYFLEWFMTLFFLEDKIRERAANEAKKLMMGLPAKSTSAKK